MPTRFRLIYSDAISLTHLYVAIRQQQVPGGINLEVAMPLK
jgi:hypothetical protein